MKSSTFIKSIVAFLLIFTAFHYVVWTKYTAPIYEDKVLTGGLSRLAYDTEVIPQSEHFYPPSQRIELADYDGENFEVMVIGDSFSRGEFSYGKTQFNFFQDHMKIGEGAKILTFSDRTFQHSKKNKSYNIDNVVALVNSGFLSEKGVKHLVLESVQRLVVPRFFRETDFEQEGDLSYLEGYQKILKQRRTVLERRDSAKGSAKKRGWKLDGRLLFRFINNRNYNAAFYNIGYQIDDNAFGSLCYKVDLSKDFFSSSKPRRLLFYHSDVRNLRSEKPRLIKSMNDNFNRLNELLKEQGIKFYFMPVVDKYTLYSSFIPDNPYPESILFEELDSLPKDYFLINTHTTRQKKVKYS